MKLQSIRGRLPGGAVNMTLDGPVIITGPNDSGKTTLLNAASVAMSGTSADLGVDGHVELDFDEAPHQVSRWMDEKGKHQMQVGRTMGVRKAGAEAERMLGSAGTFSAVAFLALSADKKQASLDQSGAVRTALDVVVVRQSLVGAGWAESALLELDVGAGRGRAPSWPRVNEGQRYLSECRDWLREQHKANEARIKSLRGAQAEANKSTPEMPEGTAATWTAKQAVLNESLVAIAARRGELKGQNAGRKLIEDRLAKVTATIAHTQAKVADYPRIIKQDKQTSADARDRIEELAQSISKAIQEGKDAAVAVKEYTRAERGVTSELEEINKGVDQAEAMAGAASTLQVLVDASANVVAEYPEDRALTVSEQSLQDAVFSISSLTGGAVNAGLLERRKELAVQRSGIRAQLDAAQRRQRASADSVQRMERAKALKTTEHDRSDSSVVTKGGALEMYDKQILGLSKEREELTDQLSESPSVDSSAVDIEEQGARSELAEVGDVLQRFADAAGALAGIEERRADLTDAIDKRARIVDAGKTVKRVLLESMAKALAPLTDIASGITHDVMGATMTLISDTGINLVLDFDGVPVHLTDASNSQRMTALMALQVAVQSKVTGWRSVFLDDLEGLEHARRTKFVQAMAKAVRDGLIDNFVAASVEDGWVPPTDVQHVNLGV